MEQKCLNPNNQKTLSGSPKSKCFLGKRKSKGVDGCFRYKAETELNVLCSDVVEARGIEPLSENPSSQLSPSAGSYFEFPRRSGSCQPMRVGSPKVMTGKKALPGSRSPLIDASSRAAVLPVKTAA